MGVLNPPPWVKLWLPVIVGLTAVIALSLAYHWWQPWLAYETGSRNDPGTHATPPNYNYWSGFGSVFPWEIGFFVGVWTRVYQQSRKANCHTHGCWRLGMYPVEAGGYRVCKKHHLEIAGEHPTIEYLKAVHSGRSSANPCCHCQPDSSEHGAGPEHVSGVHGHDQPADAPGDPGQSGS